TLTDIFFAVTGSQRAPLFLKQVGAEWTPVSSPQFCSDVRRLMKGLRNFGIARTDRIAILSENRYEWVVADFACLLLGAVVVPIYTTLTAEQIAYLLRNSGARVIFVSSPKHLEKVLSIITATAIEKVVVMDPVLNERATNMPWLIESSGELDFERKDCNVHAHDIATIIYTSGTTGVPKGVVLSHGNIAANISCFLEDVGFEAGMSSISFLPLSHVTARTVDLGLIYSGVTLAHLSQLDRLSHALLAVRPHILLGVPRVYEKIRAQAELGARDFPKKTIYQWALQVGRKHRAHTLMGQTPSSLSWKLANRLVYSKIRAGLGGRVAIFISGGAPLGLPLAEWYVDIGLRIFEGYGLTETSPVIAVNTRRAFRVGSVGKPLANVKVTIAADGEILVRGPSVFQGYWNLAEETQTAFEDGWFKTGDIGKIDEDGFLYVTDRKKDLLKTSGGKFIAPQPIETLLKQHSLVSEAVVVGDKQKFPAVLLFPHFAALEEWAREKSLNFQSREQFVKLPQVQQQYATIVSQVNEGLAQFEKLKNYRVIAEELSAANQTLTASLKIRRRAIEQHFQAEIREMYAEPQRAGDLQ
ncbi:MAG: long-chain fatty acid--CoA ligase, partial [Acidobacteria bacterium]|nr:long-chain fatty acid--CoA ligase [Acidobacteriota bacterium]